LLAHSLDTLAKKSTSTRVEEPTLLCNQLNRRIFLSTHQNQLNFSKTRGRGVGLLYFSPAPGLNRDNFAYNPPILVGQRRT
jgi:hypothetical protein